jgi:NAD(P)-dependent dehydrogenase (short-subunit alcohol dehydrogenase family)
MHPALTSGTVAVITGAASGIGKAVAHRLVDEGLSVALLDINAGKLATTEAELGALRATGGKQKVEGFHLDVSDRVAYQAVADRILRDWGVPRFLMNNAAAFVHGGTGGILDPLESWRRLFEVNFFGVLNGVAAFLPSMLAADAPSIVVNTGSKQGITHPPGNAAYNSVKAALNGYTMNLARDLRTREAGKVSAHLLVPGWTTTGDKAHRQGAWTAEQVATYLFAHLEAGDFYIICPDDETSNETDKKRILWQALDMVENRPALSRWHEDYAGAFAEFMAKPLR